MNLVNINIERPNFDKTNSSRNIEVMNRWISDTSDKLNYLIALINSGEIGGAVESDHGFDSSDTKDGNASEWTNVEPLKSGEKDRSILEKISRMFRNVRYLFKVMGNTDISSIGGGTATGAINYLKQNLEKQSEKIGSLNADLAKQWEKIYPVGSIYISANSASPANLFGGTWEQIKDRFLLAAGDAYVAGDSGGSASHSHTLSANGAACIGNYANVTAFFTGYKYFWKDYSTGTNMWAWTHNGDDQFTSSTDHYDDGSFVGLTGSTDSDNSMPPYLVLYMWRRVA